MVKCVAPGNASYRGKKIVIAADGSCELSEEAFTEMRAHGFREWESSPAPTETAIDDTPENPATGNVETMSRRALMKALKGRARGNFMAMSTAELQRLVRETTGE